jgi:hypothetical protein
MLLLEVLVRRVLSHHITCSNSTSGSTTSSSSQRSSSGVRLWQQLLRFLSGVKPNEPHCFLAVLMSVPANHPELQPGLLGLLVSLQKLSRQQGTGTQLEVADAAAKYAKSVIDTFSDLGIPSLVDLRTWRAMIAPWVVIIGLYCCELGRWLQRWHQEQLQALQQPNNSISCNRAAADAVLLQFNQFDHAAGAIIGHPELQRVSDLWESGTDSSSSGDDGSSSVPAEGGDSGAPDDAGASLVDKLQQWQQSVAAGGQLQQWQAPADTAAAGVEATVGELASAATAAADVEAPAATAATSQQFAAAPDALLSPQQQQQPQQQQPVRVPAYGRLDEEFSLLSSEVTNELEETWHVVRHTRRQLKSCAKPRSSSSSSDDSCDDGLSSEEDCSDVKASHSDQYVAAAQRRVTEASSIQSSMQACLEYEGFTESIEMLQGVGEAICSKVPVPWMCNNPGCTNMAGASELQLVGGKACVCGGCRVAR